MIATTDRAAVGVMLKGLDGAIDLIVPRGGKSLVARVSGRRPRAGARASRRRLPRLCACKSRPGNGARNRAQRQDAAHRRLRRGRNPADRPRHSQIAWRGHPAKIWHKAGCEIRGDEAVRAVFPHCRDRHGRRLAHRISRRDHRREGGRRRRRRDPPYRDLWLAPHRIDRHATTRPRPSDSSARSIPRL